MKSSEWREARQRLLAVRNESVARMLAGEDVELVGPVLLPAEIIDVVVEEFANTEWMLRDAADQLKDGTLPRAALLDIHAKVLGLMSRLRNLRPAVVESGSDEGGA